MPKITFQHSGKSVDANEGEWMYEVTERAEAGIPFACKAGACGSRAAPVVEGIEALGKVTAREARTLTDRRLDEDRYRLPCLEDVGSGDVVWGQPVNAPEADTELGGHRLLVESYRPLNLTVAEVRFYIEARGSDFRPGQYVIFHVPGPPHSVRRSYPISTPPPNARHFKVCVRAVSGGFGSNYIHRLRPGDGLEVEGPFGDFVLDEDSDRDILMIESFCDKLTAMGFPEEALRDERFF